MIHLLIVLDEAIEEAMDVRVVCLALSRNRLPVTA